MYIVGLTGGIGSGKTTISQFFLNNNIEVINSDAISREVVQPGTNALAKIEERFGAEILTESRVLNRPRMRSIIFKDDDQKVWLENLLHPLIRDAISLSIAHAKSDYVVLESPLLLETDQHKLVDRILVVDISPKTQLERTLSRDGGSKDTIKSIIDSQLTRSERLNRADDVINNEQDIQSVRSEFESIHENYLILARQK